jgi:hypothetical protein
MRKKSYDFPSVLFSDWRLPYTMFALQTSFKSLLLGGGGGGRGGSKIHSRGDCEYTRRNILETLSTSKNSASNDML